mgnify:FL=1
MIVVFAIDDTDVTVGGVLRLAIPGSFVAAKHTEGVYRALDAGVQAAALCRVQASGTYIELFATIAGGTFAVTAADDTTCRGALAFEVQ